MWADLAKLDFSHCHFWLCLIMNEVRGSPGWATTLRHPDDLNSEARIHDTQSSMLTMMEAVILVWGGNRSAYQLPDRVEEGGTKEKQRGDVKKRKTSAGRIHSVIFLITPFLLPSLLLSSPPSFCPLLFPRLLTQKINVLRWFLNGSQEALWTELWFNSYCSLHVAPSPPPSTSRLNKLSLTLSSTPVYLQPAEPQQTLHE